MHTKHFMLYARNVPCIISLYAECSLSWSWERLRDKRSQWSFIFFKETIWSTELLNLGYLIIWSSIVQIFLEKKDFIEEIYLNSSYNSRTFSPEQKRHTFGLFYFGIKPSIFLQFTIPQILYLLSIPALKIRIARFCGRQMCHIFQFSQLTWRQNPTMCWIMATIKAQPKMEKEMPNMWNHQHLSSKQLLAFSSSSAIAIFPREISCSCWCFSNTEEEKKSE